MDRTLRMICAIVAVGLLLGSGLLGFFAYVDHSYKTSLTGTYDYQISIFTDSPLHDAIFLIPLPVDRDGTSEIVKKAGMWDIYGMPDEWACDLVGTDEYLMLKIQADEILPSYQPLAVPADDDDDDDNTAAVDAGDAGEIIVPVRISIRADVTPPVAHHLNGAVWDASEAAGTGGVINTRDPLNESIVLKPKYGMKEVPCRFPVQQGAASPVCLEYRGSIFACYTTSPDAKVEISVRLCGSNDWFIFGWTGNEYLDAMSVVISGESCGWHDTDGRLDAGIGRYSIF